MSKIILGRAKKNAVSIDLDLLLRTRLLIQAGSGGGKSYLLRRLAEQLFGKVPVFIIDPEGEFATLREKFGYVLVGKGGETPADPRSAEVVAKKLLELKASAVCDIYELKPHARHNWVRLFLETLIDAPKNLWHPRIVIVDEAHVLCPERGQGESEAYGAMVDLATRGRKRGLASVFATQRLGKLSKNASAELLNRLVGPTFEDIDLDRAADLLSILRKDRDAFFKEMKMLEPGHFYAFGRAIGPERILVEVGSVQTTHPEMGSAKYASEPPPPPEKVKALLPKLADLPKQAEEKARTEAEFRAEIRSLKAQLAAKEKTPIVSAKPTIKTETKTVEILAVPPKDIRRIEKLIVRIEKLASKFDPLEKFQADLRSVAKDLGGKLANVGKVSHAVATISHRSSPLVTKPTKASANIKRVPSVPNTLSVNEGTDGEQPLLAGERRMLNILARFHPGTRTRSQVGQLTGLSPRGGTFGNYFGRLKRSGLIEEGFDGSVRITDEGLGKMGGQPPQGPSTSEELLEMWRSKLLAGERKMLDILVETYPEPMTREALGEKSGYESKGGTFGNYLGTLRRNDLAVVEGDMVRASDALFQLHPV